MFKNYNPWDTLHVDLIGPYGNSIIQHHPGGATINNYFSLTCMMMVNPYTGWFNIVKVPTFGLGEAISCSYKL